MRGPEGKEMRGPEGKEMRGPEGRELLIKLDQLLLDSCLQRSGDK